MKIQFFLLLFVFVPSILQASSVSKESWMSQMEIALPAAFCSQQMYFRQCFEIDAIECEEMATSVNRLCLKKYKEAIPSSLEQPQDGKKWGTIIGQCAGGAFEAALSKKKINSAKCNDVNNWK